jgi:hypothetical protein
MNCKDQGLLIKNANGLAARREDPVVTAVQQLILAKALEPEFKPNLALPGLQESPVGQKLRPIPSRPYQIYFRMNP